MSVDFKEARANVRILIGPRIDPKGQFKRFKIKNSHHRRSRRDFDNEIVISLKENHPIGLLEEVLLFHSKLTNLLR